MSPKLQPDRWQNVRSENYREIRLRAQSRIAEPSPQITVRLPVTEKTGQRYHEFMAAIKISDVLELIPTAKLAAELGNADKTDFDVLKAIRTGLDAPIEFPQLEFAILPEDTVCIALESGTPCGIEIAVEVILAVKNIGVQEENVCVLLAEGTGKSTISTLEAMLEDAGLMSVGVVIHDSVDRAASGFLSASESGDAILLNARLVHADFVIPIGMAKAGGWKSQIEFLYPYFSDRESQKKFFKLNDRSKVAFGKEVSRWLGNIFGILVVSNNGTNVDDVLVGAQAKIQNAAIDAFKGMQLDFSPASSYPASSNESVDNDSTLADLVVAEIGPHLYGSAAEVIKLVDLVKSYCSADGTCVVLWNDDRSLESFADGEANDFDPSEILDSDSQNIFICTNQTAVKKLGFTAIHELSEIERLITRHRRCLPLKNVQFSMHGTLA